ncbi:MAG: hypothetical protein H0V67_00430, partial [Geodermatophilaceae bacterium]|nr:hypothetical protein [Geodermatophilaceae bacterium]
PQGGQYGGQQQAAPGGSSPYSPPGSAPGGSYEPPSPAGQGGSSYSPPAPENGGTSDTVSMPSTDQDADRDRPNLDKPSQ